MRIIIDNTEIPISPEQEVTIQENNSLKDLELIGDKAFSFVVPASDDLKNLYGGSLHPQSTQAPAKLPGRVASGPFTMLSGDLHVRDTTESSVEFDMRVPPGNIPSDFWNTSLRKLALPVFALPTKTVQDPLYVLNAGVDGFHSRTAARLPFTFYYLANFSTIIVKVGGQQIFSHFTAVLGYGFDSRDILQLTELQAAITAYNANPVLANTSLFASDSEFILNYTGTARVDIEIFYNATAANGTFPFSVYFNDIQNISHESAIDTLQDAGSKLTVAAGAKEYLFFPTAFSPNYYQDKSEDFNGSVNSRDGGVLQMNTATLPVAYPLSPAFRWLFIIDEILKLHGFTRTGDWSTWSNFAFMAFVDFAKQHPAISMPFNIYPTESAIATYLPDWTVREFFSEYMKQTGSHLTFNSETKTLSATSFNTVLTATPTILDAAQIVSLAFYETTDYKLEYASINDEELLSDEIKLFLGSEDDMAAATPISLKAVPMPELPATYNQRRGAFSGSHPDRANGTWVGVLVEATADTPTLFVMGVVKSSFFELSENEPICRSLFLSGQSATNKEVYSLGFSGAGTIKEKYIDPLISLKTGRKTEAIAYLLPLQNRSISFAKPLIYIGVKYLVWSKETTLKAHKHLHEVRLTLETLS